MRMSCICILGLLWLSDEGAQKQMQYFVIERICYAGGYYRYFIGRD